MKFLAFWRRAASHNDWALIDKFPDLRAAKAGCSADLKSIWQSISVEAALRGRDYLVLAPGGAHEARAPHNGRGLRWRKVTVDTLRQDAL